MDWSRENRRRFSIKMQRSSLGTEDRIAILRIKFIASSDCLGRRPCVAGQIMRGRNAARWHKRIQETHQTWDLDRMIRNM